MSDSRRNRGGRAAASPHVGDGSEPATPRAAEPTGPDLARAALEAALRKRVVSKPAQPRTREKKRGWSGPGPDPRDPALFGDVLARLMKQRGWLLPAAQGRLFGSWTEVVGPDIAAHSRPTTLDDGTLTIEAESTAWATQLRLLNRTILARIGSVVGHNVVTMLRIHGPAAPSWSKGNRRVRGKGPGDTFG